MNLSKPKRAAVKLMFGGKCAYCGIELDARWHVDHVKPVLREGTVIGHRLVNKGAMRKHLNENVANIYPSCAPCNIDKNSIPLEEWREWLQVGMIAAMRRDLPNFRHAERFGLVAVTGKPIVFWFERFKKPLPGAGDGGGE